MKGLPARTGLAWLKAGFALFRQQPGILTMIIFANLLFSMLMSRLPQLGAILAFAALPCFSMAIQQACRLIDEGQRVGPDVLMTGFRKDTLWPLYRLGLIYLGAVMLMKLAVTPWINAAALEHASKMVEAKQQPELDAGTMLAFTALSLMVMLTSLLLSFAPALTVWKRMSTFKAIFYSVFAVLGSKRALLMMLVGWFGIYWLLLLVLALFLGGTQIFLVVVVWSVLIATLILQCAIYAAYKQILGAPEDVPPA